MRERLFLTDPMAALRIRPVMPGRGFWEALWPQMSTRNTVNP